MWYSTRRVPLLVLTILSVFLSIFGIPAHANKVPELLYNAEGWRVHLHYDGNSPSMCTAQVLSEQVTFMIATGKEGPYFLFFASPDWNFPIITSDIKMSSKGKSGKVGGDMVLFLPDSELEGDSIVAAMARENTLGMLKMVFSFGEDVVNLTDTSETTLASFSVYGAENAMTALEKCIEDF